MQENSYIIIMVVDCQSIIFFWVYLKVEGPHSMSMVSPIFIYTKMEKIISPIQKKINEEKLKMEKEGKFITKPFVNKLTKHGEFPEQLNVHESYKSSLSRNGHKPRGRKDNGFI